MGNSNKEIEIDEDKAYAELCEIIAEAIQTQDTNLLEMRINEWKRKYPYNKFSKNLKSKIDYILNQYYSELIEYIVKTIKKQEEKKEFNQSKSLVELYKIIKSTNDIKDLNKKVEKWKSKYPIDNFMKMYKSKAQKYTSQKYIEENSFDTEKAFYDLYYMLKTNSTFDELKEKVSIWERDYFIGEKYNTDDFKKHSSDVKALLNEEYLYSISKEDEKENSLKTKENSLTLQAASFVAFTEVIKSGNMSKVIEWIYKNKNISFNNFYKEQIISKTAFKFPISMLENKEFKLNLNRPGLSFEEYQNIESSRKYVIAMFINNLMKEKSQSETTLQSAFNKSEIAKSFKLKKEDSVISKQINEKTDTNVNDFKQESVPVVDAINDEIKENNNEPIIIELNEEAKENEIVIDLTNEENNKNTDLKNGINQVIDIQPEEENDFSIINETGKNDFSSEYIIFNPDFITAVYVKSNLAEEIPATIEKVDKMVSDAVKEEPMEQKEFVFLDINS